MSRKMLKWAYMSEKKTYFTLFGPQLLTILVLKFEEVQFTYYPLLCLKIAGWVANDVDPDETV